MTTKDTPEKNGTTPWLIAAQEGHLNIVQFLVQAGADKEKTKDNGATAILLAAEEGKFEVVRFLVESGAEKDRASDRGATPLHSAAYGGHTDIVKLLMEAGANTMQACPTPLFLASQQGHQSSRCCPMSTGSWRFHKSGGK